MHDFIYSIIVIFINDKYWMFGSDFIYLLLLQFFFRYTPYFKWMKHLDMHLLLCVWMKLKYVDYFLLQIPISHGFPTA